MAPRGVAALVSVALSIIACRGESTTERKSTVAASSAVASATMPGAGTLPTAGVVSDSMCDDLVDQGLLVPDSLRSVVIARLGRPDSSRTERVTNRHDAARTDSIIELYYPGLRLRYYVVGEGGKEFFQSADVLNNRYLRYPSIGVGAKTADIIAALGEPASRTDDTYRYDCGGHFMEQTSVLFHVAGDSVMSVEYSFYLD